MSSDYFSLMDLAIAAVPVVVFCIWQLVSVNREIAKDKAKKDAAERALPESDIPAGALPERAGHPIRQHRLDDR